MKVNSIRPVGSGNVTPEIIAAWKKEYPRGVFEIAVNTDEELGEVEEVNEKGRKEKVMKYVQKKAWFRKPTRNEISSALTIKNDVLKMQDELMRDTFLGGDTELIDDEEYSDAAMTVFDEVQKTRVAEIKKV